MKFPPDLIARVRASLQRTGFCFLSCDEIQRLLTAVPESRPARHQALLEFAEICGAEVETTTHFKSARFVPTEAAQQKAVHPIDALLHPRAGVMKIRKRHRIVLAFWLPFLALTAGVCTLAGWAASLLYVTQAR